MSRIRIERDLAYLLSLSLSLVFFIRPVEGSIVIENLPSVKPATKVALFPPLRLKIIFFVSRKVEIFYFKKFDSMEIENESKMVVVYARRRVGYAGNFFLNFSHFEVREKRRSIPERICGENPRKKERNSREGREYLAKDDG